MQALYDIFLASAEKVLATRTALWQEEKQKLDEIIARCQFPIRESPPNDYWHAELNARSRMQNAEFFLEVVKDTYYEYREQEKKRRERG